MYLFRNLVTLIIVGLVPAVVLCALAGRWDVWNAWVTAGIFIALLAFQSVALYRKSPAILQERMQLLTGGGRVRWPLGLERQHRHSSLLTFFLAIRTITTEVINGARNGRSNQRQEDALACA